jgi:translation initiation factor RLI1
MEYQSNQRCAFPPCTNSFPRLNRKKKYCSGCCRVKDFNRRKRRQEKFYETPAENKDTKLAMMEPANLVAPSISSLQTEATQAEVKKGMTLTGVGEAAIGTAGVMLLKDQLFDKEHRNQLQQQMSQLLKHQAMLSRQIQAINQKIDKLSKETTPSWSKNLLM